MKKMRRSIVVLVLLYLSCLMCACSGKKTVSVKNTDGSTTKITYENHGVLTRAPVFSNNEKKITMQFNGTKWYTAEAIGEKEAESISEKELLAQSSNIQVYRNEDDEWYGYVYVIKLEGSDVAYIEINSMDEPDKHGYGTDFDYFISYAVDGLVTEPDMDWKLVE